MNAVNRRVLAMAGRVTEFARAHPSTDSGFTAVLAKFQAGLTRAQALALQEHKGRVDEQAAVATRRVLRRRTLAPLMRHLSNVAAVAGIRAEQFRMPLFAAPHAVFITAAKSMLAAATERREQLEAAGLGDTLLDDLAQGIAAFDTATATINSGQREHIGARADIGAIARELLQLARVLDGLVRAKYSDDAELLASWVSARAVLRPVRVGRRHPVEPEPEPLGASQPEAEPVDAAA